MRQHRITGDTHPDQSSQWHEVSACCLADGRVDWPGDEYRDVPDAPPHAKEGEVMPQINECQHDWKRQVREVQLLGDFCTKCRMWICFAPESQPAQPDRAETATTEEVVRVLRSYYDRAQERLRNAEHGGDERSQSLYYAIGNWFAEATAEVVATLKRREADNA